MNEHSVYLLKQIYQLEKRLEQDKSFYFYLGLVEGMAIVVVVSLAVWGIWWVL